MNPLGKSDILPSTSRYLKDLRDWQQQIYAKIVTGELPLEYFDEFVPDLATSDIDTTLTKDEIADLDETLRALAGSTVREHHHPLAIARQLLLGAAEEGRHLGVMGHSRWVGIERRHLRAHRTFDDLGDLQATRDEGIGYRH